MNDPYIFSLGILNLGLGLVYGYQARTGRSLTGRPTMTSDKAVARWALAFGVVGTALVVYSFT